MILHTFLSDDAVKRAVGLVRDGAERAGRDPASVKVWTVLAVACNASEERRLKLLTARMATYLQAPRYGELLFEINGWDPAGPRRLPRAAPSCSRSRARSTRSRRPTSCARSATACPTSGCPAADGTPEQCARRIADQFAAGADGVILHASLPHEAAPAIEAYGKIRDAARFAGAPAGRAPSAWPRLRRAAR